jgi:hypothetical protein
LARESQKAHEPAQMESFENKLLGSGVSDMQRAQLLGYWHQYVEQAP